MILARYVSLAFIGTVVLTLATLVTLVTAVTLVENAGILANQAGGGITALGMAIFGGVDYAYQVLPIACFVGVLATGCALAQRGELLAIEAMGRGPWRVGMPILLVTGLIAGLGSACAETVMPVTAAERARLQREQIQRVDALTKFYHHRNPWVRRGPWLMYLPELDREAVRFVRPVIYRIDDGVLTQSIEADALSHDPKFGWTLTHARSEGVLERGLSAHPTMPLPLDIAPEDLVDVTGNPRELESRALFALIRRRDRAGLDTAGHRIEWHTRFAHPFSALALVLLGLPWSLDPERRRTLPGALGPGVAAIALFLFATQVFRLLALAHKVTPGLGAWGAPSLVVVCVPASMWAYRHLRR